MTDVVPQMLGPGACFQTLCAIQDHADGRALGRRNSKGQPDPALPYLYPFQSCAVPTVSTDAAGWRASSVPKNSSSMPRLGFRAQAHRRL